MQQHTIQIFMWAWYPESAKIHQKVSGGFWRIQDMSNIYTGGFWWIQDTSILCVTKLVDFGGFRILSSKNTQGVRVKHLKSSIKLFVKTKKFTRKAQYKTKNTLLKNTKYDVKETNEGKSETHGISWGEKGRRMKGLKTVVGERREWDKLCMICFKNFNRFIW